MEAVEQPQLEPPIIAEPVVPPEIDPFLLHQDVIEMFPELDLTKILQEYGHMTSEGLVNMVVDNIDQIPKKRGTKRKPEENVGHHSEGETEESLSDTELMDGDLLVDKMLGEMILTLKTELRKNETDAQVPMEKFEHAKNYLMDEFPNVRSDFIRRMLGVLHGNVAAVMIACFFCENNFGTKLQKIAPDLNQKFWCLTATPIQNKRISKKAKRTASVFVYMQKGLERYNTILTDYEQLYPELLAGHKLSPQARQFKWERPNEQAVECLVCYDMMPISRMVYCSAPIATSDDSNLILLLDDDQPCSSSTAAANASFRSIQNLYTEPGEGNQESDGVHAFCRGCLRGQAEAATTEMPLAEGGVGLRCMFPGCSNPILYSEVRQFLKREVRKKLDERILEENIGMALLQNLERCRKCNFAVVMDVPPEVNKVFHCPSCDAQLCRLCDNDWDEEHFGITCDELDVKKNRDKKHRDLEKKMNEAVIRKCPQCGTQFMKSDGCNKMTCRCGVKMCYICRATKIDYSHFCQHFRDPTVKDFKCTQCKKTCLLYEDARKLDENAIQQIRREVAAEPRTSNQPGPSHANATAPNNNTPEAQNNREAIRLLYGPGPGVLIEEQEQPERPPNPMVQFRGLGRDEAEQRLVERLRRAFEADAHGPWIRRHMENIGRLPAANQRQQLEQLLAAFRDRGLGGGPPEACPTCPGRVMLARQPDGTGLCPTCNGRVAAPRAVDPPPGHFLFYARHPPPRQGQPLGGAFYPPPFYAPPPANPAQGQQQQQPGPVAAQPPQNIAPFRPMPAPYQAIPGNYPVPQQREPVQYHIGPWVHQQQQPVQPMPGPAPQLLQQQQPRQLYIEQLYNQPPYRPPYYYPPPPAQVDAPRPEARAADGDRIENRNAMGMQPGPDIPFLEVQDVLDPVGAPPPPVIQELIDNYMYDDQLQQQPLENPPPVPAQQPQQQLEPPVRDPPAQPDQPQQQQAVNDPLDLGDLDDHAMMLLFQALGDDGDGAAPAGGAGQPREQEAPQRRGNFAALRVERARRRREHLLNRRRELHQRGLLRQANAPDSDNEEEGVQLLPPLRRRHRGGNGNHWHQHLAAPAPDPIQPPDLQPFVIDARPRSPTPPPQPANIAVQPRFGVARRGGMQMARRDGMLPRNQLGGFRPAGDLLRERDRMAPEQAADQPAVPAVPALAAARGRPMARRGRNRVGYVRWRGRGEHNEPEEAYSSDTD